MRRFRVLILVIMAIFFASVAALNHAKANVATKVVRTNETRSFSVTCEKLGTTSYGKPVYLLKYNSLETLPHVTLTSWSGNLLPVLFVGKGLPPAWSFERPGRLPVAPYTLFAGYELVFVGSGGTRQTCFISWLEGGTMKYESIELRT